MRLGMCHVVVLISVVRHRTLVGLRTVLAVAHDYIFAGIIFATMPATHNILLEPRKGLTDAFVLCALSWWWEYQMPTRDEDYPD
jgi:hypothetical protein